MNDQIRNGKLMTFGESFRERSDLRNVKITQSFYSLTAWQILDEARGFSRLR